jgi:hypothetical protein
MLCTAVKRHACLPSQERRHLAEAALVLRPTSGPVIRARPHCLLQHVPKHVTTLKCNILPFTCSELRQQTGKAHPCIDIYLLLHLPS